MSLLTQYNFWGNIVRFHGFYAAFWIFVMILSIPIIQPGYNEQNLILLVFLFFSFLWGVIYLWLHPIIMIKEQGIQVIRLGIIKRLVKWNNMRLLKKVRTISRFGMIGSDPRFLKIVIKDAIFADREIIILPFFNDFEALTIFIANKLDKKDIFEDKVYM